MQGEIQWETRLSRENIGWLISFDSERHALTTADT